MSPFRDSFGEEWVDMDEEETSIKGKGEDLLIEAKVDRNGGYQTSRKDFNEKGECMPALIEPSCQARTASGFESKEENSIHFHGKKEKLLVEVEFEISASCEGKGNIEEDIFELKGKQCLKNSNEHYLELECSKHEYMQDKIPPMEPCQGRASGEGKRVPMMKRVMSEASFMRGQVMVSKREVIQSVMSKREYSKAKEGTFNNVNWGRKETLGMREYEENDEGMVEVVLNKNGSDVRRDNMKKDASEVLVGARQVPSMVYETLLDAMHTCPSTSKEVCMHQTALKAVCTPPKIPKHSSKHPMSKGFMSLEEVQLHSEVLEPAKVHSEATSASLETQMRSKTEVAGNRQLKALEEAHMPSEKLKSTQMLTKMRVVAAAAAAAGFQMKDSEGVGMEPKEAKAHTKLRRAGSEQLKTLEMVHTGEKSPQREQRGGVGKQANGGQLEVKEVECECCGMREECSIGYIEHVKAVFSGHWICGLCAEAVHEERHRLGKGVPMEEAVRIHMNLCKQFSSKKKVGESPHGIGVAHAVCHLLSRHLSSPTSPRHTSPARPLLARTSSCLPFT